jgi:hypothetical protein
MLIIAVGTVLLCTGSRVHSYSGGAVLSAAAQSKAGRLAVLDD